MKKSRYSESQIVQILKEVEGGRLVKEVCQEYGIADATYYNWKSTYGGMEASDVKRLKELEEENRRLKQMYAELSLDHNLLKDVIEKKKAVTPAVRRERVNYLKQTHGVSFRRACRITGISDAVYRYRPESSRDEPVIAALRSAIQSTLQQAVQGVAAMEAWLESHAGTSAVRCLQPEPATTRQEAARLKTS